MLDTWIESEDPKKEEATASANDDRLYRAMVEHTLERELLRRRGLRAHAQLGLRPDADAASITKASQRLRAHYDPDSYAQYGLKAVALATRIVTLLDESSGYMRDATPTRQAKTIRNQQGERARAFLRSTIERRCAEAIAHRDAGRIPDAIHGFEAVLEVDRHHEVAIRELKQLRDQSSAETRHGLWVSLVNALGRLRGWK